MTQACSCRDYNEFLSKLQVFRREAIEPLSAPRPPQSSRLRRPPHPEPRAARVEGYLRRSEPSYSHSHSRARRRAGWGDCRRQPFVASFYEGCLRQDTLRDDGKILAPNSRRLFFVLVSTLNSLAPIIFHRRVSLRAVSGDPPISRELIRFERWHAAIFPVLVPYRRRALLILLVSLIGIGLQTAIPLLLARRDQRRRRRRLRASHPH